MSSAIIAISHLAQGDIKKEQLTNFLFYLPIEPLKKYVDVKNLSKASIKHTKNELIEIIVASKGEKKTCLSLL